MFDKRIIKYLIPEILLLLLIFSLPAIAGDLQPQDLISENISTTFIAPIPVEQEVSLYTTLGLQGIIDETVFLDALKGYNKINPEKHILALADFSKASTEKRFLVIDLENNKILFNSYVAHGKNSGENWATRFSNTPESFQSSLGFYLTGPVIQSPKHGPALELNGLEKGFNDNAKSREIIMHSADYVSDDFVRSQGRLGRSYGCPALPSGINEKVIHTINNGCVLFIYGNDKNYLAQSQYLKD